MNTQKFIKEKLKGIDYHTFYNIAAYFLHIEGYKDISIVDGANDKGTDVTTSSTNAQIQLSVNKKWQDKINSELDKAKKYNKSTLLYITNQRISDEDISKFKLTQKYNNEITLIIHDLDRVSTKLSLPMYLKRSYELLGIEIPISIEATQEDIAISNILLLSNEAGDLRENIIETRILTYLYKKGDATQEEITSFLINENFEKRIIDKGFSKLQQEKKIILSNNIFTLSGQQLDNFTAVEAKYKLDIKNDRNKLIEKLGINEHLVDKILELGLEILTKIKGNISIYDILSNSDQLELNSTITKLEDLISSNNLNHRKKEVYEILSSLNIIKINQYKNTLQYITQTTTYDIYRILQKNTKIKIILDTSVAMPMLFALELGDYNNKFVKTAKYLVDLARKHDFELIIPAPYVSEFAGHGFSICDLPEYNEILENSDNRDIFGILQGSQNAFISFYANFNEKNNLSVKDFLEHFGIVLEKRGKDLYQERARNTIHDLLINHGINVIQLDYNLDYDNSYKTIKDLVDEKKMSNPRYSKSEFLLQNDAKICTYLKQQTDSGYIFATWDSIFPKALERISRIYANTPPKIMDMLCFCRNLDSQMNLDMYTTLMFSDEEKLMRLAKKIEAIKSPNERLKKIEITKTIRKQRDFKDSDWLEDREVFDNVLNTWE